MRTSRLNALDRSLGFLAGIIAAVFILGAAYIPFASAWSTPAEQPSWLREAKLRPAIEWASGVVASVLPASLTERLPKSEADGTSGQTYEELAKPPQPEAKTGTDGGYTDEQRRDMERLMNSTGGH